MSFWFRDYVYISLGGSRISVARTYINLFLVFVVTGLWHGASWNFVAWGLIHGFVIVLERRFPKFFTAIPNFLKWLYTILVVMFAWVFFASESLSGACIYMTKLFSFDFDSATFFRSYLIDLKFWIMLPIGLIFCHPFIWSRVIGPMRNRVTIRKGLYYIMLFMLLILSLIYLSSASYDPFIYFRF